MLSFIKPKSQPVHTFKLQLPRFAHLEPGRVHLEAMECQTNSFIFDLGKCLTRWCFQRAQP